MTSDNRNIKTKLNKGSIRDHNLVDQYINRIRIGQCYLNIDEFLERNCELGNEKLRCYLLFAVFLEEVFDKARSKFSKHIKTDCGKEIRNSNNK